ncbi:MAG TPA: serine hydrolase domain-containing protein [Allosphingosinicella sp.]
MFVSGPEWARASGFMAALYASKEARESWIAANVSAAGLKESSAADWSDFMAAIAAGPGPLRLIGVREKGRYLHLQVLVGKGRLREILLRRDAERPELFDRLWRHAWPYEDHDAPDPAPLTEKGLQHELHRRIGHAVGHDDFSGVARVERGRRIVYQQAAGFADRAAGRPNSMETPFGIASMGKMFTTAAIAQLMDAGRLTLETRLADVLPDYPNREAARAITIGQLLSHSAGLGGFFDRPGVIGARFQTATEALKFFADQPLAFTPGSRFDYSNEGFIVLGAVIERLTGRSYYDHVRRALFEPLGMANTGYMSRDSKVPIATGYAFAENDPLGFGERFPAPRPASPPPGYTGTSAGGAYSTAADLARFLKALRAGRIMRPATARLLIAPPLPDTNYGYGLEVESHEGRTFVGHGGSDTSGMEGAAFIDWDRGDLYVLLGNYAPPYGQILARDVASALARTL